MAYQYPLNGGRINASVGGNSTSAGAGYKLISTGTLQLAGGNNITLSQNGQSISIVGGGGAALSAGTQSVNTGTVNFANSNGVSFGMSASNQITASFSQTVQTIGGYASGNTTGQSSSSTFDARSLSISGGGALSIGYSASALQLSAPAQSSLSQTGALSISRNGNTISIGVPAISMGMSNIGNTSGSSGTASNQLLFAGGNNITLSQSTGVGGNTLTISAANQTNQSLGLYAVSNTTQSTSGTVDARTLSFQGAGNVSVGVSNGSVIVSGGGGAGGGVALYDGVNSISSGTARVSAGGGLTASINGQTLSLSAPAQSSLSATGIFSISANGSTISMGAAAYSAGISTNGNTSGTTGFATNQLLLAGGNNITLSQSTGAGGNTLTISAANQTNQSLGLYGVGNTTGQSSSSTFDARTLSFQGAGAASVGYSNGSVIISAPNAAAGNVTFSAGGSSAGLGSIVFSNSNGVSFGLNGSTITASAAGGGGGGGVALYDGVNSISSGTASLLAGGALSASINGQTLSLNAPATSSLSATGAVSIATNGGTISIGAPVATGVRWEYPQHAFTSLPGGFGQNILSLQHMFVPYNVSGTAAKIGGSVSAGTHTSASTGNITMNLMMGIYTLNGSTLSLVTQSSGSASISFAISSNSTASVNAMRQLTVPMNVNLTPGEYWVGALMNTSTNYASNPLSMTMYGNSVIASANNNAILSPIGVHSTASQRDVFLFQGLYSTTISSMPSSISGGHINNTASSAVQRAAFYHAFFSATY